MVQLIRDCTRSTLHSKTTIDHIMTNREELYVTSGVVPMGISDHDLVFTSRKKGKLDKSFHYIKCRSYTNLDPIAFQHDIYNCDWDSILTCFDPDAAVELFNKTFLLIVDKHAPYKRFKMRDNAPGWMNGDMLAHINEREYWSRKFKKSGDANHLALKINAKFRTCQLKLSLQSDYFDQRLQNCGSDA